MALVLKIAFCIYFDKINALFVIAGWSLTGNRLFIFLSDATETLGSSTSKDSTTEVKESFRKTCGSSTLWRDAYDSISFGYHEAKSDKSSEADDHDIEKGTLIWTAALRHSKN